MEIRSIVRRLFRKRYRGHKGPLPAPTREAVRRNGIAGSRYGDQQFDRNPRSRWKHD